MKNESVLENASEVRPIPSSPIDSTTTTPTPPGATRRDESSVAKAMRVLDNTETVMGGPRQIVDAGLIGVCIAFLIALLTIAQKNFDAHLGDAVISFGIALPLLGWGYLQAAVEQKPTPGWLLLKAILIGSWVAEGIGEIAACIGLLFVLWHFSFSAFLAAILASAFVLVVVPILSFIGLLVYAVVKELAGKQQAIDTAAPAPTVKEHP